MKEKIEEILTNLGIEGLDANDVTNQIAKEVALYTVPKDKFNDLSKRLKEESSTKTSMENELETLKVQVDGSKEKDTEIEKLKKMIDAQNKTLEDQIVKSNRAQAKTILLDAGVAEDKLDTLLEQVVSTDEEKTISLAKNFAEILNTKVTETKRNVESDSLQNMSKPTVKTEPNTKEVTKEDFNKMSYSERKELFLSNKELFEKLSD